MAASAVASNNHAVKRSVAGKKSLKDRFAQYIRYNAEYFIANAAAKNGNGYVAAELMGEAREYPSMRIMREVEEYKAAARGLL